MTIALTTKQKEVLEYLVQYTFENLYQPSLREICEHFQIASTNALYCRLKGLVDKGYIELGGQNSRAIKIKDKALYFVKITDNVRARPLVLDILVK